MFENPNLAPPAFDQGVTQYTGIKCSDKLLWHQKMTTDLLVHGPYVVPFRVSALGAKCVDKSEVKEFWAKTETAAFRPKHGVYVFALKAAKGFKPVYVGKATKGFGQEALHVTKLYHYNQALVDGGKGTPVMFFVAAGEGLNKVPAKTCDEIETFLIQLAIRKNPELRNIMKSRLADWSIKGLVRGGAGKPSITAVAFGKMIGM